MYSEDVNIVFGFEPSGLFEKVIFAPAIGIPRVPSSRTLEDAPELGSPSVPCSVGVAVAGVSAFVTFGIVIFGRDGNCPAAGSIKNDAIATAAIRINDEDLAMNILL